MTALVGMSTEPDSDRKWVKIQKNTFSFYAVSDPLERANLKDRERFVHRRLVAEYDAWNQTMLSEEPKNYSEKINGTYWTDHYGNAPD
jgi:hypothetical protein